LMESNEWIEEEGNDIKRAIDFIDSNPKIL
jgi:hypothetical protein